MEISSQHIVMEQAKPFLSTALILSATAIQKGQMINGIELEVQNMSAQSIPPSRILCHINGVKAGRRWEGGFIKTSARPYVFTSIPSIRPLEKTVLRLLMWPDPLSEISSIDLTAMATRDVRSTGKFVEHFDTPVAVSLQLTPPKVPQFSLTRIVVSSPPNGNFSIRPYLRLTDSDTPPDSPFPQIIERVNFAAFHALYGHLKAKKDSCRIAGFIQGSTETTRREPMFLDPSLRFIIFHTVKSRQLKKNGAGWVSPMMALFSHHPEKPDNPFSLKSMILPLQADR
ncbi:MAG: hypothetical protein AB7E52_05275 [Bdellovibrionales bacterium]